MLTGIRIVEFEALMRSTGPQRDIGAIMPVGDPPRQGQDGAVILKELTERGLL